MELNPNNPLVRQVHDHWHKIAALIMVKLGLTELKITLQDVEKIAAGDVNIVMDGRGEQAGGFTIRIVDDKAAAELARKEGGRLKDC